MRKGIFSILLFTIAVTAKSQGNENDTTKAPLTVGAYLDLYYNYNFNKPSDGYNPYFVSYNRHNEINVNLAYADLNYKTSNFKSRIALGVGTYMNANYAAESGTLKNIVEASVSLRLSEKKGIWLEAGVLSSPYTNESAISKDQLMYTRTLASENVPYYLSGVRLITPLSSKVNLYLSVLNGWQVIQGPGKHLSYATRLEILPNSKIQINWNTFIGNTQSAQQPKFRMRYFNDVYLIYTSSKKWEATTNFYYGVQEKEEGKTVFWQGNGVARYSFTNQWSLSGRLEYFSDTGVSEFPVVDTESAYKTFSAGLCLNYKINQHAMARLDGRQFFAPGKVYVSPYDNPTYNQFWLTGNITFWY